jgi:hypothetical protein
MFPTYGLHRLHRLHRLNRLSRLRGLSRLSRLQEIASAARPRRSPSIGRILLAGLAVLAFVKLMSMASGRRSRPGRIALGVLLLAVGAVVLSMRRSARRRGW